MDFLERFHERDRDRLVAAATTVRLSRGELLLRRGEKGGDLYRVTEGELEVVDTRSQPVIVLDVLGRGSVVGEMAFLADSVRSADVRAPEGAICQRWERAQLLRLLESEPAFGASFYRVLCSMLVQRATSVAMGRPGAGAGIPRGPTNEAAAGDGLALAEALEAQLMSLEPLIRRDRDAAERELGTALRNFTAAMGEALGRMSADDGRVAGGVIARGLHPYVMRSHLGEYALDRDAGVVSVRAAVGHILANHADGDGPLGAMLDAWLLGLPTAKGIRERAAMALQVVGDLLPGDPPLRMVVLSAAGGLAAALPRELRGRMPGEVTVIDGDRAALSAVETAPGTRGKDLRVRLLQEDLAAIALGTSKLTLSGQNVVVIDGLLEYLPERLAAGVLRWARAALAPGGSVLLTSLLPSTDDPLFRYLLAWPLVRRSRAATERLLASTGYAEVRAYPVAGTALVATGRVAGSRQA